MILIKKALFVAVALSAFAASQANAALVIYNIAGTGSGSLNGAAFNNAAFTFTLTGDTLNLTNNTIRPLTSATASIAGFNTATFLISTRLGVSSSNIAFFGNAGGNGNDLFDFSTASAINLKTSFGPVAGGSPFALGQFINIATTGGALTFNNASNVQFSGQVGSVTPAVPEPATWAMMIGGMGMVGGAMRRRKSRVSTKVAFA